MPEENENPMEQPNQEPAGGEGGSPNPTLTPEQMQAELEKLRADVKRVNRESADRRKKLEAYEEEERKRKEAELTEAERLTRQIQEAQAARERAEQALATAQLETAALAVAFELGFAHPPDALRLADLSRVTREEDGTYAGLQEALEPLAKEKRLPLREAAPGPPAVGTPKPAANVAKPGAAAPQQPPRRRSTL